MTYKIGATEITIQPTTGRWMPRSIIGEDGNGRAIYSGVREFELSWQLVNQSQVNQLVGFFGAVGNTGTSVVSLPEFGASTYTFFDYTGCVVREPEWNTFFNEHTTNIVLLITKIVT